ncbi:MAG: DUF6941 family protein, partial [Ktedonobacterales bacterium]
VNNTPDGKLNIMGLFNTVRATSFPTTLHEMRLIVKFQFTSAERKMTKTVQFKLLDPDGVELISIAQPIQVPDDLAPEVVHIVSVRGITFPKTGDYAFHVLVDSDDKTNIPLHVAQAPDMQGG